MYPINSKTTDPIPVLGMNHDGTSLYPPQVWAQQNSIKWQSVNVDVHLAGEQQGFICERKTIKAQDICFDTEQSVCHLKYIPKKALKLYLPMLENDVFV